MKAALYKFHSGQWQRHPQSQPLSEDAARLVLCFASRSALETSPIYSQLHTRFPHAEIVICSTAGEIYHTEVLDDGLSLVALDFDTTEVVTRSVHISSYSNSYEAGTALIQAFAMENLSHVLVFSDGSHVNGSELVRGMNAINSQSVLVTGGLAGDGDRFESTFVGLNGHPEQGLIVGVGFYGDKLQVGHGSQGGWETFGLERMVTRSDGNVLFEMDDKNALELYKRYLGTEAESLPGAALLFPLAVKLPGITAPIVRTILSIDSDKGSMTFAGDIPEGASVRFMRANFDKLTIAASGAATQSFQQGSQQPGFALLISCIGRKMILKSRTEEEVEAVDEIFGHHTLLSGFYSYGELSPLQDGMSCQLHNQTMTITTFHEVE